MIKSGDYVFYLRHASKSYFPCIFWQTLNSPQNIFVPLYLCISVSLYLCISVAVSGELVQIKNCLDFHFWYWFTDFVFEFSSIEIVILTLKCELKKDVNHISIFILASNKLTCNFNWKKHYVGCALISELLTFLRGHWYKKPDIKDVLPYSALLRKINSPRIKYFLSQPIEFSS